MKFITKRREVSVSSAVDVNGATLDSLFGAPWRSLPLSGKSWCDRLTTALAPSLSLSHLLSHCLIVREVSLSLSLQGGFVLNSLRNFYSHLQTVSWRVEKVKLSACELHENVQIIDLLFEPRFCAFGRYFLRVLFAPIGPFCCWSAAADCVPRLRWRCIKWWKK